MNFFGDAARSRPQPTIKKVMVKMPVKTPSKPATPLSRPSSAVQRRPPPPQPRNSDAKDRVKRLVKRKSHTPTPVMSSEDESDGESSAISSSPNKRARTVAHPIDSDRRIMDLKNRSKKDGGVFKFIHGAELVAGEARKKYSNAFGGDSKKAAMIELQYPSDSRREKFALVYNEVKTAFNTNADFQPHDDIKETIKFICQHYLPEEMSTKHLNPDTGFEWHLNKAIRHGYAEDYKKVVDDFNKMIVKARDDGTIRSVLEEKHGVPLPLVQRILDQVYSRTVSPDVDSLRAYEGFSDNVYGELKPRLIHDMFEETRLKSNHVFVDLGSGVGNVVLQAALEVGCESWGIEMMENPCKLAELQRDEFAARARLWGLSVGKVHLLKGDFTQNTKITEVLRRADVVLVNNQAFNPDLNANLITMFLDLKDGCKIVSLKPFKPEGLELKESNINDLAHSFVDERKLNFYSDSVSWTDAHGHYHIVTKDVAKSVRMKEQLLQRGGRRSGRLG